MQFGICTGAENTRLLADAGYDYLELGVTSALQPERPDNEVIPALETALAASALKAETYNVLLPGDLKVVGPRTDSARQERYLEEALRRAARLGGQVAVFGSGGSRAVLPGWTAEQAWTQTVEFLGRAGAAAARHGMAVAIEPLNVSECNFINSVAEGVRLARDTDHPAVGVLSDLYHVTHDGQNYEETRDAAPWLRHVHVAGAGRRAPIAADSDYLRGYFAVLKGSGYAGRISVEGHWDDLAAQVSETLAVLRQAWADA